MSGLQFELPETLLDRLADLVAERLARRENGSEPWVDVKRAAEHLACKPHRIYDLVERGRVPHRRDGSRLLFRLSELDEWLSES